MASIPNVVYVPTRLSADTTSTSLPTQAAAPRVTTAPFPTNLGGGAADPIGPQRWPTKL